MSRVEARIRNPNLPPAPHYEGNVGKKPPEKRNIIFRDWPAIDPEPEEPVKERKKLSKPSHEEVAQIREMMGQGKRTKEIAKFLGRPEGSVKRYKRQIRRGELS